MLITQADVSRDLAFAGAICASALLILVIFAVVLVVRALRPRLRSAAAGVACAWSVWKVDREWRAMERAQAAQAREIHHRVMAGYWRATLPATLLAPTAGDSRGAWLTVGWELGHAIAARLDTAAAGTADTQAGGDAA